MACCSSSNSMPQDWGNFPSQPSNKPEYELATQYYLDLRNIVFIHNLNAESYEANVAFRTTVIAIVIIGLIVGFLALQGKLTTFPSHLIKFFENVNWIHVGIGGGTLTVLVGGAAIVIERVVHTEECPFTENKVGTFTEDQAWRPVGYLSHKHGAHPGFVDVSTLDDNGDGYALFYGKKWESDHYLVSIELLIGTLPYLIGVVVYNVIRVAIVPFYILGAMLYQRTCSSHQYKPQEKFTFTHIPIEMGKSLVRVVKAPFYATAYLIAILYSFFDPLNGRKLGSLVEKDWNEGVERPQGFWSVGCGQELWMWEGGGTADGMGKNGYYLAGCWQPFARFRYKNHQIVDAESMSRTIELNDPQIKEKFPGKAEIGEVYWGFDRTNGKAVYKHRLQTLNEELARIAAKKRAPQPPSEGQPTEG